MPQGLFVGVIDKSKTDEHQKAVSPINIIALEREIESYKLPEKELIINGFLHGFPLHYNGKREFRMSKNLKSALERPDIVSSKIEKEIKKGELGAPLKHLHFPISDLHQ